MTVSDTGHSSSLSALASAGASGPASRSASSMVSPLEMQLSAHLDGVETEAERQDVEMLLVNDPQARGIYEALKRGGDAARRALDGMLHEPVPLDMVRAIKQAPLPRRAVRLPHPTRPRLAFKPSGPQALGACLVFLVLGGGLGYMLGAAPGMPGSMSSGVDVGVDQRDWLDDVVAHYRLYTRQKDRLVEIPASRPAEILEWLTTGTGVSFRIPDLTQSGLSFVGARMFAADGRPFGLLLYRRGDDGEIIGIAVGRSRPDTAKPIEDIRSDTGLVTWSTPLATYVIVGPSSAADLDDIAAKAAGLI